MSSDAVVGSGRSTLLTRGTAHGSPQMAACVRFDEVLVLQGAPVLGALLSVGRPTLEQLPTLALFAAGSCCLVAHVFVLNDWAGMRSDLRDANRARHVFAARGVPRR